MCVFLDSCSGLGLTLMPGTVVFELSTFSESFSCKFDSPGSPENLAGKLSSLQRVLRCTFCLSTELPRADTGNFFGGRSVQALHGTPEAALCREKPTVMSKLSFGEGSLLSLVFLSRTPKALGKPSFFKYGLKLFRFFFFFKEIKILDIRHQILGTGSWR